jgi:mRNA interferase YafQ
MPRALAETRQFRADKKRIKHSGRHDWEKMRQVVKELMNDRPLAKKHRDHELAGDYAGARECRVEPDWLPNSFARARTANCSERPPSGPCVSAQHDNASCRIGQRSLDGVGG